MTAPLFGPFFSSEQVGTMSLTQKTSYKQRRPYSIPSPWTYNKWQIYEFWQRAPDYNELNMPPDAALQGLILDRARERFVTKVRGRAAELAVSLAERKQALAMIENRAIQLYRFARELKSFRFGNAAHELSLTGVFPKGLKANAKAFGNNYLEFHFGWSPLVGDIGNAVEVLQGGVPPVHVSAVSSGTKSFEWVHPYGLTQRANHQELAKVGATFVVSNPNLWLANQLGFVNPATIAWELVPFSFVLDWFVNVSDFLNSSSEFWGLSVIDPYFTQFSRVPQSNTYVPPYPTDPYAGYEVQGIRVRCKRTLGLPPGPELRVRDPWVLSPRRGLAAMSLLLQQLR